MNLIRSLAFVGSLILGGAMANVMRSTWPPIYNPGEECLAYDGSKVPDCRDFIVPGTGEPYYHPHSFNCSRFWECGPTYETCLFECAPCQLEIGANPQCQGQWALSFDPEIQYPFGPVCKWPFEVDCDNDPAPCDCLPWQSCVNDVCLPQCLEDAHCPAGYTCDDCHWCVEGPDCLGDDSNCLQGICDVPFPYSTCEYCDGDSCQPGCSSDANCPELYPVCGDGGGAHLCGCSESSQCPSGYICDTTNHTCTEDLGCQGDDSNCLQGVCDVPFPYSTCEYCDGVGDSCLPGCSSDANCPELYPVCGDGGGAHLCGCSESSQCPSGYICDTSNHVCTEDLGCNNNNMNCKQDICDEPANWPYTTCEYCDATNGKDCIPGCSGNIVCPELYPVCGSGGDDHRCGCNNNNDCAGLGNNYICDLENHVCTPGCNDDSDCPSAVCDIENTPYTTCTHCDNLLCVPGCTADEFCPTGFECVNWLCEVKPAGYVLLDSITVTGAGAGPYSMHVVGYAATAHPATCTTEQLSGSGVFTGDAQLGEVLHHGCNRAPLNGFVSGGDVIGGESWTGAKACFDWNEHDYYTYTCDISSGKLVNCKDTGGVTC